MSALRTQSDKASRFVPVRPTFVSQHTAPAVLGFKNARAYLEWIAAAGLRVVARGKDRLVLLDEAEAVLLRDGPSTSESTPEQPDTCDAVLRIIGRRRRGGSK
jgi:hypothetical protein